MLDKFRYLFSNRPILLGYSMTEKCNSRCEQCMYWRKKPDIKNELTLEEIKRIFKDLYDFGIRYISLSGGEPLLRPDIIEAAEAISDIGIRVWITTNGILLNEDRIKEFARIKKLGFIVSFDTLDRERYQKIRGVDKLNTVLKNISLIKKHIGIVRLTTVVSSLNYDEVDNIIDFCKKNGYYVSFQPYNEDYIKLINKSKRLRFKKNRKVISDIFYRLVKRKDKCLYGNSFIYKKAGDYVLGKPLGKCAAGYDSLSLEYDGKLYPCIGKLKPILDLRKDSSNLRKRYVLDEKEIMRCYENTPCFRMCTRALRITRKNKWRVILEVLLHGGFWKYKRAV